MTTETDTEKLAQALRAQCNRWDEMAAKNEKESARLSHLPATHEVEIVETNEKPVELLKLTVSHYRFSTSRGDVVLQIPSSIKTSELEGVKQLFGLVLRQIERWASD